MSDALPQQTPNDGAPDEEPRAASGRNSALLDWLIEQFKAARDHRTPWREEAEQDFAFVAGHQWSSEDTEVLTRQGRPSVTFNRVGPFVDGVSGLEINNRQEVRYIPRTLGKSGVNELLTSAAMWVRDETDAEDEESEAFRDCVITGEGWTQTKLNYELDPDGMIQIERRDVLGIYPDPAARRANYADARIIFYAQDVPIDAARALAPDARSDDELDAAWARDAAENADSPHNAREAPFYRNDQSNRTDRARHYVRMVEAEWWEYAVAYRVPDPQTQRMVQLDPERFKIYEAIAEAQGQEVKAIKDRRRIYRRAILGNEILSLSDGNEKGGFSFKAITGKRDHKKRCYYGLVRPMRDPQSWANKWLSQVLHIINTNAKGGVVVEIGAVENPREFEDSWADSDAVSWVNEGASGKVQPKPPMVFPTGLQQLMQFAIESIPGVIGANPEMMGQADRMQPGIVEMQRKQSAMTIFADLFNALRRYRKEQGRLMLWLIQEYISDDRLIRIGGDDEAQYVPLSRDKTLGEYDVIVDDTPTSPNMKDRTWAALTTLFPILARMQIPPQVMMTLLEFAPLPVTLISKLKSQMQQAQQGQQSDPRIQAGVRTEQAKAQLHQAQAAKVSAETQLLPAKMQLDAQEQAARIEQLRAEALNSLQDAGVQADDVRYQQLMQAVDALLGAQQQAHDQAMDVHGAMLDAAGQSHDQAMAQQDAARNDMGAAVQAHTALNQPQQAGAAQ